MRVQPARPSNPLTTTVTERFGERSAAWSAAQSPAPPAPRIRTSVSTASTIMLVASGDLTLGKALQEQDEITRQRLERLLHVRLRGLEPRVRRLPTIGGDGHDLSRLRVHQARLDLRFHPVPEATIAGERHPRRRVVAGRKTRDPPLESKEPFTARGRRPFRHEVDARECVGGSEPL